MELISFTDKYTTSFGRIIFNKSSFLIVIMFSKSSSGIKNPLIDSESVK